MFDRSKLISKLVSSRKAREAYVRSKLNVLIPAQIRGLRLQRELTQKELGDDASMKQARISAMESPGEVNFNLETLVRLASAFKVGLIVKFVSYSEMLDWDNSFSQDNFVVTPIENDQVFIHHETRVVRGFRYENARVEAVVKKNGNYFLTATTSQDFITNAGVLIGVQEAGGLSYGTQRYQALPMPTMSAPSYPPTQIRIEDKVAS